jgi:uncharacterized protein DUF5818
MKRRLARYWIVPAALAVFATGLTHAATFRGEIGDSSCALNVHSLSRSHEEMLKNKSIGTTAAECARYCVAHLGSSFVLVVKKDVYRLDNQIAAEKFAGQTVIVTGELDTKKSTIAVKTIEPAH